VNTGASLDKGGDCVGSSPRCPRCQETDNNSQAQPAPIQKTKVIIMTKSSVVLMIGNSKSNHLGVQGTFHNGACLACLDEGSVCGFLAPVSRDEADGDLGHRHYQHLAIKKRDSVRNGACFDKGRIAGSTRAASRPGMKPTDILGTGTTSTYPLKNLPLKMPCGY